MALVNNVRRVQTRGAIKLYIKTYIYYKKCTSILGNQLIAEMGLWYFYLGREWSITGVKLS